MSKIAYICADSKDHCVTSDDGVRLRTVVASALGYTISGTDEPAAVDQAQSHHDLVMALKEARDRPTAAAALAASTNPMSLTAASAMLRGLPTETQGQHDMTATLTAADHALFNRKLELRIAALNMSSLNGSATAGIEAKKLGLALNFRNQTGMAWGAAFTAAGLDARATVTAIVKSGGV